MEDDSNRARRVSGRLIHRQWNRSNRVFRGSGLVNSRGAYNHVDDGDILDRLWRTGINCVDLGIELFAAFELKLAFVFLHKCAECIGRI